MHFYSFFCGDGVGLNEIFTVIGGLLRPVQRTTPRIDK